MMLGPILGPVIGGVLVQDASWRWIFYENLPIGAVALFLAVKLLPRAEVSRGQRLDVRGLLILSPGLAFLVYGLSEAGTAGGFGGTQTLVGVGVGLALLVLFVVNSVRRPENALIDMRLFKDRSFSAGAGTSFVFGVALFGAMILLPLYYQIVRGQGALAAGLLLAPQGIASAMFMPLAGRLTDTIGAGRVVLVGMVVMCLGTAAFAEVGAHTSYVFLCGALFVRGIGFGFTMMPAMAASYRNLEHAHVPRATTSLNIIQRVGGSIGTAIMAVTLQREMVNGLSTHGIHAVGGSLNAVASVPPGVLQKVAPVLAHAFGQTFLLALVLTAVGFLPALFLPRRVGAPVSAGRAVPTGHPSRDPVLMAE